MCERERDRDREIESEGDGERVRERERESQGHGGGERWRLRKKGNEIERVTNRIFPGACMQSREQKWNGADKVRLQVRDGIFE